MAEPSIAELEALAERAFGRTLSEAEAQAYRGRLPTMARNVERLRAWERLLRTAEPCQIQRVVSGGDDG